MVEYDDSYEYRTKISERFTWNSQMSNYSSIATLNSLNEHSSIATLNSLNEHSSIATLNSLSNHSNTATWNSINSMSRRATSFLFSEKDSLLKEKLWDKARNNLSIYSNYLYRSIFDTRMIEKKVIDLFFKKVEKILIDWNTPQYKIKEILYRVLSAEKEAILNYLDINYERAYIDEKLFSSTYHVYTFTIWDTEYELKQFLEKIILPTQNNLYVDNTDFFGCQIPGSVIPSWCHDEVPSIGESLFTAFIGVLTGQIEIVKPEESKKSNSLQSESYKDKLLEGIMHCMQYRSSLVGVV